MADFVLYYVETCEKLGVGVLMEVVEWLGLQEESAREADNNGSNPSPAHTDLLSLSATTDGEVESLCATLAKLNNGTSVDEGESVKITSRLEFFNGKFSSRGVSALASTIENDKCIQALRLCNCQVGDNGALGLAESLLRNPTCSLLELDLCNIGLDVRGLEALTTAGECLG
jgi:hypothetical protein